MTNEVGPIIIYFNKEIIGLIGFPTLYNLNNFFCIIIICIYRTSWEAIYCHFSLLVSLSAVWLLL